MGQERFPDWIIFTLIYKDKSKTLSTEYRAPATSESDLNFRLSAIFILWTLQSLIVRRYLFYGARMCLEVLGGQCEQLPMWQTFILFVL